ncbi:MAG: hypothetical protein KDB22_22795 [Planctomycetales bacterium]|nr:hypothetical protein [Planctomycetales bacterium]
MEITDEELIAYLLGDTTLSQKSRIEQALIQDPTIADRLKHLRFVVGLVDSLSLEEPGNLFEPPPDLVESTMARIDSEVGSSLPDAMVRLSPAHTTPLTRISWLDSSVLCVCIATICCLILPAVVRARYDARKAHCAQKIRFVGDNLVNHAMLDPAGRFPHVAVSGPEAFAGVYVVDLNQGSDDLIPISRLRCPSLFDSDRRTDFVLPKVSGRSALYRMSPEQLSLFQETIGGDYAYSLGVLEEERIVAPKFDGRSTFAILADAPVISSVGELRDAYPAHGGRGMNVFYEDGRVVFISSRAFENGCNSFDDPFRNIRNTHEVGLTPQDASLAPSSFPPVANIDQRP